LTETSNCEICKAVINAVDAHEILEINGGDNVDNNIPAEPRPTRRQVLEAVSVISKYTNDLIDLIARKMERILVDFSRQLHMQNTEFFEKNTYVY
jgi:hypothetical protein